MTRGFGWMVLLVTPLAFMQCSGVRAPDAVASEESLRDSFAEQIEMTDQVSDFSRDGDELTFVGPDGEGSTTDWRVMVDSLLVEPRQFDDERPHEGRVTSDWYADGEMIEYLGNMTALPDAYLDRGLGQECWAYWIEAEKRWDW